MTMVSEWVSCIVCSDDVCVSDKTIRGSNVHSLQVAHTLVHVLYLEVPLRYTISYRRNPPAETIVHLPPARETCRPVPPCAASGRILITFVLIHDKW